MFLPSFTNLPYSMAFTTAGGYFFGKLAGFPKHWAKIAAIVTLAHDILFLSAIRSQKDENANYANFAITSYGANILHISTLKYMNLISIKGTVLLFALATISFYNRTQELDKHGSHKYSDFIHPTNF